MKRLIIMAGVLLILLSLTVYMYYENHQLKKSLKESNWELEQWKKINSLIAREIKPTEDQIKNFTFQGAGYSMMSGGCKVPEIRGRASYSNGNLTKSYSRYVFCLPESGERSIWVEEDS